MLSCSILTFSFFVKCNYSKLGTSVATLDIEGGGFSGNDCIWRQRAQKICANSDRVRGLDNDATFSSSQQLKNVSTGIFWDVLWLQCRWNLLDIKDCNAMDAVYLYMVQCHARFSDWYQATTSQWNRSQLLCVVLPSKNKKAKNLQMLWHKNLCLWDCGSPFCFPSQVGSGSGESWGSAPLMRLN